MDWLLANYLWIKALHVISVIFWMAGMAYFPRLLVYHRESAVGSETSELFKVMEHRLMRIIINPAMIATFAFGIVMLTVNPSLFSDGWMHAKLALIVVMAGLHGMFSRWRKAFARDERPYSTKAFRIINEVPPVLVIFIVVLAIVKPF